VVAAMAAMGVAVMAVGAAAADKPLWQEVRFGEEICLIGGRTAKRGFSGRTRTAEIQIRWKR
jgi:hypothetical protein